MAAALAAPSIDDAFAAPPTPAAETIVCSACGTSRPLHQFPAFQRRQPADRRRCLACIMRLINNGRTSLHDRQEHAIHNATPNMTAAYESLTPDTLRELETIAEERLLAWQQSADDARNEAEFGTGSDYHEPRPDERFDVLEWSQDAVQDPENEVCIVKDVLTDAECDAALAAIHARADARGGWQANYHKYHPTTDMRCAEALSDCADVEQMVRAAVFSKVCEPLVKRWAGHGFLAEHLIFRDFFFVHYSAADGEQRGLKLHQDGSLFSFNILLSSPSDFDGGGTFFTLPGWPKDHGHTVSIPRGAALVHSGSRTHGGRDITRGTRDLLVGFMGLPKVAPSPPSDGAEFTRAACTDAARDSFCKFGAGAWKRAEPTPAGAALPLSAGEGC